MQASSLCRKWSIRARQRRTPHEAPIGFPLAFPDCLGHVATEEEAIEGAAAVMQLYREQAVYLERVDGEAAGADKGCARTFPVKLENGRVYLDMAIAAAP